MKNYIDLQNACGAIIPVSDDVLISWARLPMMELKQRGELTLRLVSVQEITQLNTIYRKQNKATNVLAFPYKIPDAVLLEYPLLGDVIICPTILADENEEWGSLLIHHWAHIVIHGVLHLLGYDHIKQEDQEIMQNLEINLLRKLGFPNPYSIRGENV